MHNRLTPVGFMTLIRNLPLAAHNKKKLKYSIYVCYVTRRICGRLLEYSLFPADTHREYTKVPVHKSMLKMASAKLAFV